MMGFTVLFCECVISSLMKARGTTTSVFDDHFPFNSPSILLSYVLEENLSYKCTGFSWDGAPVA